MPSLLNLKKSYKVKRRDIKKRLQDFKQVGKYSTGRQLFEELAYCIFTAGASARMGLNAVNAVKGIMHTADASEISISLKGVYRFPNSRSGYLVHTREYLKKNHNMDIRSILECNFTHAGLRRFFATNKDIKGIGFKESSHFLRNIGYRGYGILDKHIISCMFELGLTESNKPPAGEKKYLELEEKLRRFSRENDIDFDDLDLLLWSEKTGAILK